MEGRGTSWETEEYWRGIMTTLGLLHLFDDEMKV